jgi:glycosyltransferase involved in cell wall biosynthesis
LTSIPRISVGVPVYNGEAYIAQALDALVRQTFHDFEIVISDNASRDHTAEICQAYANRDARIKYHRSDTLLPPAENHNRTFYLSTGEFFKWATHDDLCAPSFLERCLEVMERDPSVVLAYPKARIIDPEGAPLGEYNYRLNTDSRRVSQRFGALVRANHRVHGAFEIYGLIRAAALRRIPPMGNYPRADSLVLARLSLLGSFAEIPEVLFLSRDHETRSVRALPARIRGGRTRLHRYIGTGPVPPLEWWDPTKKGIVDFPEWRIAKEYVDSVLHAPISFKERLSCFGQIAVWLLRAWPKLGRDLVIASEQLLMGTPASRQAARS